MLLFYIYFIDSLAERVDFFHSVFVLSPARRCITTVTSC